MTLWADTAPGETRVSYERLLDLGVVKKDDAEEVRNLYSGLDGLPPDLQILDFLNLRDLARFDGDNDARLHALLMGMFLSVNQGSLCLRIRQETLREVLVEFLPEDRAQELAAGIVAWWPNSGRNRSIVADGNDPAPLVGDRFRPLICRGDDVYFHRHFAAHRSVADLMRGRLGQAAIDWPNLAGLADILRQVLVENPLRQANVPVSLNSEQQCAVALSALRRLLIVSGGPGTGKTSTVFTILRVLLRTGLTPDRVRLAAPTGRAARRMTESIRAGFGSLAERAHPADAALSGLAGTTLHRLLSYDVGRTRFRFDAANPLPVDLVIVDEVSMVDVVMMASLLEAVPPSARLVLLGDKDQLPSVEAGAVLADLLPPGTHTFLSAPTIERLRRVLGAGFDEPNGEEEPRNVPADTIVVLRKNYRSQAHIQKVAEAVNVGRADVVGELPLLELSECSDGALRWPQLAELTRPGGPHSGGCWLLAPPSNAPWEEVLDAWAVGHFLGGDNSYRDLVQRCAGVNSADLLRRPEMAELLDRIEDFRVLTLVREGTHGSQWINGYLARQLRSRLDEGARGGLFAGEPVMVVRNDHIRQVYNGDVGVCVRSADGALRVIFRGPDGLVGYAPDALPPHELGFAVTVHKGQGSEYRQVLLALPSQTDHRLLSRQIVYTGLTRAKDLVVIAGEDDVLRAAISRHIERNGGGLW